MQINTLINQHKKKFDKFYINILNKKLDNSLLSKAMKYSSADGGKRIRAFLVLQSSKMGIYQKVLECLKIIRWGVEPRREYYRLRKHILT